MTAAHNTYDPLPAAPTAAAPVGLTPDGAARSVWYPNVTVWVAVWRFVVSVYVALIALVEHAAGTREVLWVAAGYAGVTAIVAMLKPRWSGWLPYVACDVLVCAGLLTLAAGGDAFSAALLYAFSAVVAAGARRPSDAFVAAGACGLTYAVTGVLRPVDDGALGTGVALFLFFAVATAGFFTVVRRIGALEVATEIARERGRYRRDLHDRLGQALCGLHFELQAVHAVGLDEEAPNRMASLADGYRSARAMLEDLFRQVEDPLLATNVAALIEQEARRLAEQSGARIDVTVEGEPSRIPPWMRAHVWAVAGECMTNALKNGHATGVEIDLAVVHDLLVLSVTDDGVGFDCPDGELPDVPGHYGLREMRERARICGGEVVVASQPSFGTRVRLQAPIPEDAVEDIIERDVGALRSDIWTLVVALRATLGVIAVVQLAAHLLTGGTPLGWGVIALMTVDIALATLRRGRARLVLRRMPVAALVPILGYGAAFGVSLLLNLPPAFMLYAPLLLLAAAVSAGRRACVWLTGAFVAATALGVGAAHLISPIGGGEARTALTYITNMALIGLSAAQGARLLDRLEALQIRVRYQALARLRHGLTNRMRDRLTALLEILEQRARDMTTGQVDPQDFNATTEALTEGSSELKARLREIVHQLADPPPSPGRTQNHV